MSGVPENSVGTTNYGNHLHEVVVSGHSHTFTLQDHSHSVTLQNHVHTVVTPNHSHSVVTPSHSHTVEIPSHGHELEYGIYEEPALPTSVTIKVDNNAVPGTAISGKNIDLIPYLAKDANGKVLRDQWHTVELKPNGLARINAQIVSRLFIQSRLGGNY